MKVVKLLIIFSLLYFVQQASAQQTKDSWAKWKHLIGSWIGDESGKPGQGTGAFTFSTDLDSNILVRKSRTTFPTTGKRTGFNHDDLLIVYRDTSGFPAKAIYFDNENHVLNYTIVYTDSSIVLTSDVLPDMARFRLTYTTISNKKVDVKFEMAIPPDHIKFVMYIEGIATKKD